MREATANRKALEPRRFETSRGVCCRSVPAASRVVLPDASARRSSADPCRGRGRPPRLVTLDVDVREPGGQVPVPPAEKLHARRQQHGVDDRRGRRRRVEPGRKPGANFFGGCAAQGVMTSGQDPGHGLRVLASRSFAAPTLQGREAGRGTRYRSRSPRPACARDQAAAHCRSRGRSLGAHPLGRGDHGCPAC